METEHTSIWLRPARGSRGRAPEHTRDGIAAAAVRLADSDGLGAVTMRSVAEALGRRTRVALPLRASPATSSSRSWSTRSTARSTTRALDRRRLAHRPARARPAEPRRLPAAPVARRHPRRDRRPRTATPSSTSSTPWVRCRTSTSTATASSRPSASSRAVVRLLARTEIEQRGTRAARPAPPARGRRPPRARPAGRRPPAPRRRAGGAARRGRRGPDRAAAHAHPARSARAPRPPAPAAVRTSRRRCGVPGRAPARRAAARAAPRAGSSGRSWSARETRAAPRARSSSSPTPDQSSPVQQPGEHERVLERERGTLRPHGTGRVGGVADEHDPPPAPAVAPHLVDRRRVQRPRVGQRGVHRRPGHRGERRRTWSGARSRRSRPCRAGCPTRSRTPASVSTGISRSVPPAPDHAVQHSTPGLGTTNRQLDRVIAEACGTSPPTASRTVDRTPSAPTTRSYDPTSPDANVTRTSARAALHGVHRVTPAHVAVEPAAQDVEQVAADARRPTGDRRPRTSPRPRRTAADRTRSGTRDAAHERPAPRPRPPLPGRPAPPPRCRAGSGRGPRRRTVRRGGPPACTTVRAATTPWRARDPRRPPRPPGRGQPWARGRMLRLQRKRLPGS